MVERLKIEIDVGQVLSALQHLPPSAMRNAWRRTLRKTSVWVKSQTAKLVSKETKIPQKLIRQRLYFFLRNMDTGKVWLGLNDIEAHRIGTPVQRKRDVYEKAVGKHSGRTRSFYSRTASWIQVGRYRFASAWHMSERDPGGAIYQRTGKDRKPYEMAKVDFGQAGEKAFRAAASRVENRLMIILMQEVNYELQKALGRAR